MGWQEGFRLGQNAYEQGMRQAQQERENKWADEQRTRTRQDWADQDLARQGAIKVRGDLQSQLDKDTDAPDGGTLLGIQPPQAPQRQYPVAPVQAGTPAPVDPTSADQPDQQPPQTALPAAPQQGLKRGDYTNAQIAALRSQLAMAGNDPKAIAQIQSQYSKMKLDQQDAAIKNYIMTADQDHLDTLMGQVSADRRNTFEIKPSTTPGLYDVKEGNTKVPMTRGQLAEWIAANHRLKNGDTTALETMRNIDKDLASRVEETYKRATDSAKQSKDNFAAASLDKFHTAEAEAAKERAAALKARAASDSSKYDWRMDESAKQHLSQLGTAVRDANKNIDEVYKNSQGMPEAQIQASPQYKRAAQQLAEANRTYQVAQLRYGVISPEQIADQTLGTAKSKLEVLSNLSDLSRLMGNEYADDIAAKVTTTDAFKALPQGGSVKSPQGQPQPSAADIAAHVREQAAGVTGMRPQTQQAPATGLTPPKQKATYDTFGWR
jgi:hypothetical protein